MPLYGWLPWVFVMGACVGSFLNVCIYRLPLEKSLLWPGSHCGHCFQPIRWYDNIPLLSYWLLGGKCRTCRQKFSLRYFFVELLTALCLVGLFWLVVIDNVHQVNVQNPVLNPAQLKTALVVLFFHHALLFCLLFVATFVDLDHQLIPLPLTVIGALIGLTMSVIYPWPWPYPPLAGAFPEGTLQPWPVWFPLPRFLEPGSWLTGLSTSLGGMLMGTLALRAVRFLFGLGMGAEYSEPPPDEPNPGWAGKRFLSWMQRVGGKALGLGDADLMMMAGSFIGWQAVLLSFFVGVFPGLVFGVVQLARRKGNELAFGPALALGVMITLLCWRWLGPHFQLLFFQPMVMLILAGLSCVLMLMTTYMMRLLRMLRR